MNNKKLVVSPRVIFQVLFFIVFLPFLPLIFSWRWDWWEAWIFGILSIVNFVVSRVLAIRRHPDLAVERSQIMQQEDTKTWDKTLLTLMGYSWIFTLLVIGFDELMGWSAGFGMAVKMIALVIILGGYALSTYALIENRFFSGVVRLQTDRGQKIISSGPYRWMRHPGYAGGMLVYLATPFLLDSIYAFLPAAITTGIMVVRTALEDRFLQEELEGYDEYAKQVRYRLLPGVW